MTEKRFSLSIYFFFFWLWCHFPPTSPKFHSSSHFSGQLALVNCIKFLICSQRENKPERGTGREKVTRPKWLKSLYSIFHCKHRKGESFSIKGYCCCSLAKLCPAICDSWTAACQASQSFTISQILLKFISIVVVLTSHPLTPPSLLALNLSQHQGLFQWVSSSRQVAKALEPQNQSFQWIFRTDFL